MSISWAWGRASLGGRHQRRCLPRDPQDLAPVSEGKHGSPKESQKQKFAPVAMALGQGCGETLWWCWPAKWGEQGRKLWGLVAGWDSCAAQRVGPQTLRGLLVAAHVPRVSCPSSPGLTTLGPATLQDSRAAYLELGPATLSLHHPNGLARKSFRPNTVTDVTVPMTHKAVCRHSRFFSHPPSLQGWV